MRLFFNWQNLQDKKIAHWANRALLSVIKGWVAPRINRILFAIISRLKRLIPLAQALVTGGAVILVVAGCAYRVGQVDRQFPGGYRSVAVPIFKNRTHETGVEIYFTNAFIREMERARVGRVTDRSAADVTLEGSIDSITYAPSNQVKNDGEAGKFLPTDAILNTEYRILVRTTLQLRRNSDQKILWEGGFSGERSYLAPKIGAEGLNSANSLYNHSARHQNIQLMAADLMVEAHDRLTENF